MIARAALSVVRRMARLASLSCLACTSCGGDVDHHDAPGPGIAREPERVFCPVPDPAPAGPPCDSPADCADGAYCDFADNLCGQGARGVCVTLRGGCEYDRSEVCTCGGKVISNECLATWEGVDVSSVDECPADPGLFRCGWRFCHTASDYCRLTDGAAPWNAFCHPLPDACDVSSSGCGCLADQECGGSCEGSLADGLTVTCLCE
jgi:hypothetical protein